MDDFILDEKLQQDCIIMGSLDCSFLLLMKNALFPWFIIVPKVKQKEFHEIERNLQLRLLNEINLVSVFIKQEFNTDKLNIASIGNIVSQCHIHIVGRSRNDVCWPNVVWGTRQTRAYTVDEINAIKISLSDKLGSAFNLVDR